LWQAVVNPENTFYSVKRFIGRKGSEVKDEIKQVTFHVIIDKDDNIKLDCPALGKRFSPEEISAEVGWIVLAYDLFEFEL
jgi:molecular chaperone DnaK (HSP70)